MPWLKPNSLIQITMRLIICLTSTVADKTKEAPLSNWKQQYEIHTSRSKNLSSDLAYTQHESHWIDPNQFWRFLLIHVNFFLLDKSTFIRSWLSLILWSKQIEHTFWEASLFLFSSFFLFLSSMNYCSSRETPFFWKDKQDI